MVKLGSFLFSESQKAKIKVLARLGSYTEALGDIYFQGYAGYWKSHSLWVKE